MKRILFLAPPFYEYPALIRKEFEKRGYEVDYFNSYPSNILYKIADFFRYRRIQRLLIDSFNKRILSNVNSSYNQVFIIKASVLGSSFIKKLKEKVSARYVQYIWDDLKFDKEAKSTFLYFDKIMSYNPQDCQKEGLTLRTNFYTSLEYKKKKEVDLFFIASYKPNRLDFVKKILPEIKKKGLTCSINMKCSIFMYILTPKLWKYHQYLVFRPIKYYRMIEMLSCARAMIDVSEKNQKGLTTRPFEALHVNTKIITTNKDIHEYDFYNKNNVMVIDEECPSIDADWLNSPYVTIPETVLNKYSVKAFVDDVLN